MKTVKIDFTQGIILEKEVIDQIDYLFYQYGFAYAGGYEKDRLLGMMFKFDLLFSQDTKQIYLNGFSLTDPITKYKYNITANLNVYVTSHTDGYKILNRGDVNSHKNLSELLKFLFRFIEQSRIKFEKEKNDKIDKLEVYRNEINEKVISLTDILYKMELVDFPSDWF